MITCRNVFGKALGRLDSVDFHAASRKSRNTSSTILLETPRVPCPIDLGRIPREALPYHCNEPNPVIYFRVRLQCLGVISKWALTAAGS